MYPFILHISYKEKGQKFNFQSDLHNHIMYLIAKQYHLREAEKFTCQTQQRITKVNSQLKKMPSALPDMLL